MADLVTLLPMLTNARQGNYAVGAFNFCNVETAHAIIQTGCELRAPVLLIIGPWELPLLGIRTVVRIIRSLAEDADVSVCLHLDHAADANLVKECIEAGFPSVMIDGSHLDFEENVRLTQSVVQLAHDYGVTVEGELGAVGSVSKASPEAGNTCLTDPHLAAEFVERTGVDALAVAVGNAHGIYPRRPHLDFMRLESIAKLTAVPLVLHGGSGTPYDQLRQAIQTGVSKVNVASELSKAFLETIRCVPPNAWYAQALGEARDAVASVVAKWMHNLGCAGKIASI